MVYVYLTRLWLLAGDSPGN